MSGNKKMQEVRITVQIMTYKKMKKVAKENNVTLSDVGREALGRFLSNVPMSPSEVREVVRIKKEKEAKVTAKKPCACKSCKCKAKPTKKQAKGKK